MRKIRSFALTAALGAMLSGPPSALLAQEVVSSPTLGQTTGPEEVFDFEHDQTDRMTVPVTINGEGPYRFLIDTGSERTIIARELAGLLRLKAGPVAHVQTVTDKSKVATVVIPQLGLSRRRVRDIKAPALSKAHIGAAGMLGMDSLKSQRVVFDFVDKKMSVVSSRQEEERWEGDTIVVTARTRLGRMMLSNGAAEGARVLIILDTGSEVSIGNEALRRKLASQGKLKTPVPVTLMSITGNEIAADYTSVPRISIGGLEVRDFPIAFADARLFRELDLHDQPAMLLGMDALALFDRVSIDMNNRRVRFLLPERSAAPLLTSRD